MQEYWRTDVITVYGLNKDINGEFLTLLSLKILFDRIVVWLTDEECGEGVIFTGNQSAIL